MKKGYFVLIALGILFFVSLVSASSGSYIKQGSAFFWEEKYNPEFDVQYETQEFDFGKVNGELRIRINLLNKDFGDIEAVRLNACGVDVKPRYAKYVSNGESVLDDILEIDNNVIVAHEKEVEIVWENLGCDDVKLYLTANEYGKAGPLRFTGGYEMGSVLGRVKVGDPYCSEPLYSPLWKTSTGHPDGNAYIYVSDDSENVYFSLDITPDNTNDYGEDWVEIEVNNEKYYLDDFNDEYGSCWFGLTDKVSY